MSTKTPQYVDVRRWVTGLKLAGGLVLLSSTVLADPGHSAPSRVDNSASLIAAYRGAYPGLSVQVSPPDAIGGPLLAGIDWPRFTIRGLHVAHREDHLPSDGGSVVSYADDSGEIVVLISAAVTADEASAREYVDTQLHGISVVLPPAVDPTLGTIAYADAAGVGDTIVVAAVANVAYVVRVHLQDVGGGLPAARAIAADLRGRMVSGTPRFPELSVSLAGEVSAVSGGDAVVRVAAGARPKFRGEGGYIARGAHGPRLHPFGPGKVAIVATAVDELGRVAVARATSVAR